MFGPGWSPVLRKHRSGMSLDRKEVCSHTGLDRKEVCSYTGLDRKEVCNHLFELIMLSLPPLFLPQIFLGKLSYVLTPAPFNNFLPPLLPQNMYL